MDISAFDRLARSVGSASTRRRVFGILTSAGLGGLLSQVAVEETDAKRKRRRNKRKRRKGKRKNTNGLTDPSTCTQGSQCASGACCQGTCCQAPANQCNTAGLCCAPNCGGRACGPDGCGNAGTCGTCGDGETCDEETGQCEGPPCRTHLQSCTSTAQCCSTEHTACAYNNVVLEQDVCCSTLGGTCTTGGPSGDCCSVNGPGGADYAYCSPGGACGGEGATCRVNGACASGECCKASPGDDSGVCSGLDGCCRELRAACTSASQCCGTANTACAYNNVVLEEDVCCSTLGGACTVGGPSGDCCTVNVSGGADYAYCSPGGACGGQGAVCRVNEVCVSGQCCKASPGDDSGTCSGPGGC
jgi:hypothetical protein